MHMMSVVDFMGNVEYTQVCFLMKMMAYAVHLLAYTVH